MIFSPLKTNLLLQKITGKAKKISKVAMFRIPRIVLLVGAVVLLMHGLASGIFRAGWLSLLGARDFSAWHGHLMVCGFLGVVISLERVIALKKWWCWGAPLFTGIGMFAVLLQRNLFPGMVIVTLGSVVYLFIQLYLLVKYPNGPNGIMSLGAFFWLLANILSIIGFVPNQILLLWLCFLLFTIIGERLELSKILGSTVPVKILTYSILALFLLGALVSFKFYALGFRIFGTGLVLICFWAWRGDLAFRNWKKPLVTGYTARALVGAWIWCLFGGVIFLIFAGSRAGMLYDAIIHSLFLGFVFSMIFGHAPIIFPAVLSLDIPFSKILYIPFILLHSSLILRVISGFSGNRELRQWATMANAVSILLFLLCMAALVIKAARKISKSHK